MEPIIYEKGKFFSIELSGELDHHYAAEIRDKVDRKFYKSACKDMVVDFSDVTFMDSSGIGLLIGRYKNVKEKGGKMYAVNLNPSIKRMFDMAGLRKIIDCAESVDDLDRGR